MQDIQTLHIKNITRKLVILMKRIAGDQRGQLIHSIRVFDIKVLDNEVVLGIMSLIKETNLTTYMAYIYNKEPKLYDVSHLTIFKKNKKL